MQLDNEKIYSIEINVSGVKYSIYQGKMYYVDEPIRIRFYRDGTGVNEMLPDRELTHIELYNHLINFIEKDLRDAKQTN